jgi:hypothetical protein
MARRSQAELDMRDVRRAFRRLDPVFKEHLGFAVETTGGDVVRLAQQYAPVRYGTLRSFIAMKFNKRAGTAKVGIRGGATTDPTGKTVYPYVYGRFLHNGTKRIRGVPFLLMAAEANRRPFADNVKKATLDAAKQLNTEYRSGVGRVA